jgi:hypothetical protein
MTLDQVRAFANSRDQSIRQIALTKEGAKALIREHDREVNAAAGDPMLFEPKDRADEGKFVAEQFGRIAACLADEERLFGETGQRTRAGEMEAR